MQTTWSGGLDSSLHARSPEADYIGGTVPRHVPPGIPPRTATVTMGALPAPSTQSSTAAQPGPPPARPFAAVGTPTAGGTPRRAGAPPSAAGASQTLGHAFAGRGARPSPRGRRKGQHGTPERMDTGPRKMRSRTGTAIDFKLNETLTRRTWKSGVVQSLCNEMDERGGSGGTRATLAPHRVASAGGGQLAPIDAPPHLNG
eukprot:gene7144-19309_t